MNYPTLPRPLDEWQITDWIESISGQDKVYVARKTVGRETYLSFITEYRVPIGGAHEVNEIIREKGGIEAARLWFRSVIDETVQKMKLFELLHACPNILAVEEYSLVQAEDGVGWILYTRQRYAERLRNVLNSKEKLTLSEILRFGTDIGSALEALERVNVVLSDLALSYFYVNSEGHYLLGAFENFVRADYAGRFCHHIGTQIWISPEVHRGSTPDRRSSIYMLGLLMYWMANGRRLPFENGEYMGMAQRQEAMFRRFSGESFPALSIPKPVNDVILKACAFDPDDRYSCAAEFCESLIEASEGIDKEQQTGGKQTRRLNSTAQMDIPNLEKENDKGNKTSILEKQAGRNGIGLKRFMEKFQSAFKKFKGCSDFSGTQSHCNEHLGHQVLISYSSREYPTALHVKSVLESNGIRCWMAPDSIPLGTDYASMIVKAIRECTVFVLVLSENAQRSKYVTKELDLALSLDRVIIPVHIDRSDLSDAFSFRLTNVQRVEAFEHLNESLDTVAARICAILAGVS